LARPIIDLTF